MSSDRSGSCQCHDVRARSPASGRKVRRRRSEPAWFPGAWCVSSLSALDFIVEGEVVRRGWTPDIEGIVRRIVFGLPVAIGRNVVDVGGIFRVAAPGVAHIVEVVRAEHVAPEAPAGAEPLVRHLHGTKADLVNRADIPAEMMQARAFR